jgi:hypothetical protein
MTGGGRENKSEEARCPNHPDEEATYRCDNCGKPYCERCVKENGYDRVFCPECALFIADLIDLV